jgi:O-antigen/teichoic acid export membrane protein
MWAVPFGTGVALFADDLLTRVLGGDWGTGVTLLQATAVTLALHQIGFNWTAFYRARGETKPLAVAGVVGIVTFFAVILPLLLTRGLDGLALGIMLAEIVFMSMRMAYLRRLFPALGALRHMARAIIPVLPAVATVLLLRVAESGERGLGHAAVEAVAFTLVVGACTWTFERDLLREALGYLRRAPATAPAPGEVAPAVAAGQP